MAHSILGAALACALTAPVQESTGEVGQVDDIRRPSPSRTAPDPGADEGADPIFFSPNPMVPDDGGGATFNSGLAPGVPVDGDFWVYLDQLTGGEVPYAPGFYRIWFGGTTTGIFERVLFYVPDVQPGNKAPLLVAFHSFGHLEDDIPLNTDFFEEAQTRGWFCLAPAMAHDYQIPKANFGSVVSQQNAEDAINFLTTLYDGQVDTDRIYGVGFSMGGGTMATYASRHLDGDGLSFAALVNHTGGVSTRHTYANDQGSRPLLDHIHGGPYHLAKFSYNRTSAMSIVPSNLKAAEWNTMAVNLTHVPIRNFHVSGDPVMYLLEQHDKFSTWMAPRMTAVMEDVMGPANFHAWRTLGVHQSCDFLEQFTLQLPRKSTIRADRDGDWFHLNLTQDAAGAFSKVRWDKKGWNQLDLLETDNLAQIRVQPEVGVNPGQILLLRVQAADSTGDDVILEGYTQAPSSVTFDDTPSALWSYDSQAGTVLLPGLAHIGSTSIHRWLVYP